MKKSELKQLSCLLDSAAQELGKYSLNCTHAENRDYYWAKAELLDRARRTLQIIRPDEDY